MSATEAQIFEIFSSIQGEGLYIGERQIFIRFLMCNMSCSYCDSPESLIPQKTFRVEETPGKKDFKIYNNPATIEQLSGFVDLFSKQKTLHHSVAITGGEPLLQVDFLNSFIPKIKEKGLKIYLETNGTMPERLSEIIELVDIVAMDIKLPSMTGASDKLAEHKKALEAASSKDVFVKIVIGKQSKPLEIENASKVISEISNDIPVVLQPATPIREIKHGPTPEQMLSFHAIAKRHLNNVRVIPQVHRLLGQL
ncbi:MAG: 7-carboxy-7-deazaguanine synthase QueE [bacterium]